MYMIGIYRRDAAHPLIAMHQRQSRHTNEANVHASAEFGVAPSSVCNNQQYLYVHTADSTSSYAKEDYDPRESYRRLGMCRFHSSHLLLCCLTTNHVLDAHLLPRHPSSSAMIAKHIRLLPRQ